MNTPFGCYRWLRMPFGINSTLEVWQQRMHELVQGLTGVEVIANDFLVCGFGDTNEAAVANYDQNLKAFLRKRNQQREVETSTVTSWFHRTPPHS